MNPFYHYAASRLSNIYTKCSELVKGLGIRANKVQVLNENDCIKVKPKAWLDKRLARNARHIESTGFNWLSNDKDSYWIKMINARCNP